MGKDITSLQDENLELKLSAIKSVIDTNNKENRLEHRQMMNELRSILDHVKETNGSVARVTADLLKLQEEKKLHDKEFEELQSIVKEESKQTKMWRVISSNKWVMILLITFLYLLGSNAFRDVIFELVGKIR